jgi:prepilin-type N-terminal cleavage/methylation domain-containing protein
MMTTRTRRDEGFSLVELVLVVALLGTTLGLVYGAVQVLTKSASTSTEESAAAHDLSYSMELLSKTLMGGTVLYANDNQLVVLTRMASGAWQVSSITATSALAETRGNLTWTRWSSNASGTVPVNTIPTVWVMSDRNVNASSTPAIALFAYYKGSSDADLLIDKTDAASSGVIALIGASPEGYPPALVKRIRLHIASAFNAGMRDDFRDIVLRLGS